MFFTQEDFRKIEEWLRTRTVKDTEFPHADPLRGNEDVPIIQDGKNKTLTINELVKQVAMMELPDFFNVTTFAKKGNLFLEQAISIVPVEQRKLGLTITFHSEKGHWLIYQFKGTSLNQWSSLNYWRSPIEEALEELVLYPDEEDITGVRDGNRTFLKFKDKDYDPADFSGMGRIILRKNLVGTEACALDDEDHLLNVLTQDMIREENTIYIVQYDFDLDGKVISIPKGCTLWFQGGSINNGTIYLQETAILGAFEFADMGNVKLFGKFNTGQIMTFSDDSYQTKEGGYFIAGTKPSSATIEEDAKNQRETFYDVNPSAYATETRQELRWWNGTEWLLVLDITDYNEIKSIINDVVDKHNAEMSACYKYFKARCYTLEVRMDDAERRLSDAERRLEEHDVKLANHEVRITKNEGDIQSINQEITNIHTDITNINTNISNIEERVSTTEESIENIQNNIGTIESSIANIENVISNLEQTITNTIEKYISNNVVGVTKVTVNGTEYAPDEKGNITLPDYPTGGGGDTIIEAKELLTIKQGETTLGTYDGTEATTISIPESSGGGTGGGTADKVANKLKFTGAVTAEYDGSKEVTVNIPSGGGGGGGSQTNQPLKFTGAVDATYDGTSQVTVDIPTPSTPSISDIDTKKLILKNQAGSAKVEYDAKTEKTLQMGSVSFKENEKTTVHDATDGKETVIDMRPYENGSEKHPTILYCAQVYRTDESAPWKEQYSKKHAGVGSVTFTLNGSRLDVKLSNASNWAIFCGVAVATMAEVEGGYSTETSPVRLRSNGGWMQCDTDYANKTIHLKSWRTADKNNDSVYDDMISNDTKNHNGKLRRFTLIITGYAEQLK